MRTAIVLLGLIAFTAVASASNAEGKAYLEANKGKEGVITLASGLQYKVGLFKPSYRRLVVSDKSTR